MRHGIPTPGRHASTVTALAVGVLALAACSSTQDPTVTMTATVTTTVTTTAEPPSPEPSSTGTHISTSSTPDESMRSVDPARYRGRDRDDGYFFTSPSGNLACGILDLGVTGCQAWSLVANLPDCDRPHTVSSPTIEFVWGQHAIGLCLSNGVYSSDALTLEYGTQLRVAGITCSSQPTGITCIDDLTRRGFTASREGFIPLS